MTADNHELGLDVARRAKVIATDSPEQTKAYGAPFFLDGFPERDRVVDLADVVTGSVLSRNGAGDTTLLCSVGLAGTEVVVASRIMSALRARP
ncbi:hypothetical protein [Rhizobium sp. 18055]|uniref:hypothetical protein n=1 Tax=Rhizobium sp. 18055 TaxID=2681403 RepID=UPI00135A9C99|nr:hypothetical protein [Rhizobium sp. 18055]